MDKNKELINVYNEVFDSDGNVMACGRKKCMELIRICQTIDNTMDYGDENTGFINIENIKNLHASMSAY